MSTTVNIGWLQDNNGDRFAPKTLSSQIVTNEGILFEDEIKSKLDNFDPDVELTKAEYDALGDIVKTDGKTYYITDLDSGDLVKEVELTQAEYDALKDAGNIDKDTNYYIIDSGDNKTASDILFSESKSGLTANTVQGAIETVSEVISDAFSTEKDYVIGDYCIHNNALYEFISDKVAGVWDGNKVKHVSVASKLSEIHPIGSTYISTTNTNPSSLFGGIWELYDKEYKNQQVTPTVTQINTSAATVYAYLSNHDIQFYISYTPSAALTDSNIDLMTINPSSCGATQFSNRMKNWSHFSDGGQVAITYAFSTAGVLTSSDVMIRGSSTASIAAATGITNLNSILIKQNSISYMLDSFCDKFYWKRIA